MDPDQITDLDLQCFQKINLGPAGQRLREIYSDIMLGWAQTILLENYKYLVKINFIFALAPYINFKYKLDLFYKDSSAHQIF